MQLPLAALFGLVFASCARPELRESASPWGRELYAVASFELLARWPVAIYLLAVHGAWTWAYLTDPAPLSASAAVLALVADLACLIAGYGVGWTLLKRRQIRAARITTGAAALVALVIALVLHARLGRDGRYADFQAGHAPSIGATRLALVLAACAIGQLLSAGLVGWTLFSHGRRAAAASPLARGAAHPDPTLGPTPDPSAAQS